MAKVVYLVQDLLFTSKIRETARQLGVDAVVARDAASLHAAARDAGLVIVDLRLPAALAALDLLAGDAALAGLRKVGFIDHEKVDVMERAQAAGCRALAKGKFSTELPHLLADL